MTFLTAVEAAAILVAVAVMGDFTHFTWWAISTYVAFLGSRLCGLAQRTWVFCLCVQIIVIAGVVGMSATACDTLVDAAHDNGPVVYVVGNFAMHYWPAIGILARRPTGRPASHEAQAWSAAMLFLVYATIKRPNSVYGCPVPYDGTVVGGFVVGASAAALVSEYVVPTL